MTRSKKEDTGILIEHRHCIVCGKPVNLDKIFCGDDCKKEFEKISKKRKVQVVVLVLIYISFFLVFIIPQLFRR